MKKPATVHASLKALGYDVVSVSVSTLDGEVERVDLGPGEPPARVAQAHLDARALPTATPPRLDAMEALVLVAATGPIPPEIRAEASAVLNAAAQEILARLS